MSGSSRRGIRAAGLLLDGFAGYLRSERGVTELTVDVYVADVRRFLVGRGGGDLSELTAAEAPEAVLGRVRRAAAAPVPGRRRSLLPKGITPAQAKALLRACDRRRAGGRRDYAVIVLILRLGA